MKKILVTLVGVLIALSLIGCSGLSSDQEVYSEPQGRATYSASSSIQAHQVVLVQEAVLLRQKAGSTVLM